MRPIVLSGFAGTGKSAVGAALAARLGVPFLDTDAAIERRAGKDVGTIWRESGEGGFRALEREVATEALRGPPSVIAFGGGTVTCRAVRFEALDRATVVTLTASVEAIASRTTSAERPLLSGPDPHQRVRELLEARADAYAEHHATLDTTSLGIEDAAAHLATLRDDDSLVVPLGRRSHRYQRIGSSSKDAVLARAISELRPSTTLVVTDENVARHCAAAIAALGDVTRVVLPAGEPTKTLTTASRIWDAALDPGVDRDAVIVAFGGGVTGDLAGFAAATALRGLRWVQSPTTLLAMVDASIGGKTGFDHATGKNRIGAIHQPSAIVADLSHLATLPEREMRAGLAEIVKIAVACDADLFLALEKDPANLVEIVLRSAAAKIRLVREDENDQGVRAVLNLGHTVGHVLEAEGEYRVHLHGEAVSIGLIDEMRATERMGATPPEIVTRVKQLLERLGLPTSAGATLRTGALDRLASDKKRIGSSITLPIVTGLGTSKVERVPLPTFRSALA